MKAYFFNSILLILSIIPFSVVFGQLTASIGSQYYNLCQGTSQIIEFEGSGGAPPYIFHYSFDNGPIQTVSSGNSTTATITYEGINFGSFTCNLLQIDDQVESVTLSAFTNISVFPLPMVYTHNDTTICLGSQYYPNAGGAINYMWDHGVINGVPFSPMTTTTYTVVGTDINGCANTDQVTVTVIDSQISSTASIDSASCNDGSIYLSVTGDNPPFTTTWLNVPTQQVIGNLEPGSYTVYIQNALGCNLTETYIVPQSSQPMNCGTVKGKLVFDRNANCVEDTGDHFFKNQLLRAMPGDFYFTSDINGNFSKSLPPGNYTIEKLQNNSIFENVCNPSFNVLLEPNEIIENLNIYDTLSGGIDFYAFYNSMPILFMTPFSFTVRVAEFVENIGIIPMEAWLKLPPFVTIEEWDYPHTISNDTIYFDILGANFSNNQFKSTMTLNPGDLPLGTSLNFCFGISTNVSENNLENNTRCGSQIIGGPYDPNDILLFKNGNQSDSTLLLTDVDLTYRIRFQNTGTAEAINVFILDTISDKLDMSTLQLVETSHLCNLSILNNNVLRFDFPNIHLIDSTTNEPESHGYIFYKIKPKASNQVGDVIKNTAHIYFDFNEAVVTNTAYDSIIEPSVASISVIQKEEQLVIYPNPSQGKLHINAAHLDGLHAFQVLDLQGKILAHDKLLFVKGTATCQLTLDPGMYYLRVIDSNTTHPSIAKVRFE
jgi:uncharacterized repeat protein (TIGR01451 family)